MKKTLNTVLWAVLATLILAFSGCGGGSSAVSNTIQGNPSQNQSLSVAGTIEQVPTATYAPAYTSDMPSQVNAAPAASFITIKAGVTVRLIKVDGAGNQIGPDLATTTTDSSGKYTLTPSTSGVFTQYAGNYWVLVGSSGSGNLMRAIAVQGTVNINPVSEVATSLLIAKNVSFTRANLTHLQSFLTTVNTALQNLTPTATTLSGIVTEWTTTANQNASVTQAVTAIQSNYVTSVSISPGYVTTLVGNSVQFAATVTYSGGNTDNNVTWSVVNGAGTIDSNGLFNSTGASVGSKTVIRATSTSDTSRSNDATLEFVSYVGGCSAPPVAASSFVSSQISGVSDSSGEAHATGMANDANNNVFVATGIIAGGTASDITKIDLSVTPAKATIVNKTQIGTGRLSGLTVLPNGDIAASSADGYVYRVVAAGTVTKLSQTAFASSEKGLASDSSGNVYIADAGNNKVSKIDTTGNVTVIAGSGTSGYADGDAKTTAQFYRPAGISFDCNGNILVADMSNNRIRKINLNGSNAGQVTTVAGKANLSSSTDNADPLQAGFSAPIAVTTDSAGNVMVSDHDSGTFRRIDAITGAVTSPLGNGKPGSPLEYIAFAKNGAPIVYINYVGVRALAPIK